MEDAKEFLGKVEKEVAALVPSPELDVTPPQGYILGIFWRAYSIFKGIRLLLDNELPEEALILSRSLFVESLWLQQLQENENKRDALILGWASSSIEYIKGLFKEAEKAGLEEDASSAIEQLNKRQKSLFGYMDRHGIDRPQKFLNEGDAAKKLGRKEDYWSYMLGHQMVHGSDAAFVFRRRKVKDDLIGLFAGTSDPKIILGVAYFSSKSFLLLAKATANIFGWDNKKLDVLFEEMEEALDVE